MPHMYILECADGSYYTGSTKDLERRLWQHQNGLGAKHTAKRLPVKLVYCEFYDRVSDAFYREKQVQGWSRRKKQALIAGDTNLLHQLAECQNESHYRKAGCTTVGFGFAQPTEEPFLQEEASSLSQEEASSLSQEEASSLSQEEASSLSVVEESGRE